MTDDVRCEGAIEAALDEARRSVGVAAEAYLSSARGTSLEVRDAVVRSRSIESECGIGVRVCDDGRVGFAHTSDLSAWGVRECVALARANAALTPDGELVTFVSEPVPEDPGLAIHDSTYEDHDWAERVALARRVEEAARSADNRVSSFVSTFYRDLDGRTLFATTEGAYGSFRSSYFGVGTTCVARAGKETQVGRFGDGGRCFAHVDPARIGAEAARRAVSKLNPRRFRTCRIDVLFDPHVAAAFFGLVSSVFSAENVLRKRSAFSGRLGLRVASEAVTIVDEGRRIGGVATAPFDGEGTPTRDAVLVEQGVLVNYLHTRSTAVAMGHGTSGNARRNGYTDTPHAGISNLVVRPASCSLVGTLAATPEVLEITSLLNARKIDPSSGEFSLAATAIFLSHGEPQYALDGITIAGNLNELLGSVSDVGDDPPGGAGSVASPSLLLRKVSVASR